MREDGKVSNRIGKWTDGSESSVKGSNRRGERTVKGDGKVKVMREKGRKEEGK